MWAERLSVRRSEIAGKKSGKDSLSTQTARYDGGKAQDCHREKGSVAFGERQAYKSAETDKIRTDKRIKMVILQTKW